VLTHRAATVLGDIPPDWDRELLANLLSEKQGGDWGEDSGDVPIRVLRSTNFTDRGILNFDDVEVRYFTTTSAAEFTLRDGDLLIERSGGGPTQPVGRVGFVRSKLPNYWFSNFVQLLRPDSSKINPEFLGWLLLELNRSGVVERLQHQTTQMRNLDFRDYLRIYLPRPRPEEQKVIAQTLRIANDALISAEEKLAAAQQLKTALMQQLFTMGMPNRHRSFKAASVFRHRFEVPVEWEVAPLRGALVSVEYGTNSPSNDEKRGLPIVAIPEVVASRFRLGKCSYAEVPEHEAKSLRLECDDVLLIRTNGNPEYIGKSTVVGAEDARQHIIFASYLIRVRTKESVLSGEYLNYFLASPLGRRQCLAMANTSAGNHNLGARSIKQFCLPRPSSEEQLEIVRLVDTSEDAIESAATEVVALNNLKCSLLQNLLTGRVRFRT
jgi:type I restriction enzyme, S subunit